MKSFQNFHASLLEPCLVGPLFGRVIPRPYANVQAPIFESVEKDAGREILLHAVMITKDLFNNLNRTPDFFRRSLVRYSDICKPPYVGSSSHIFQRGINHFTVRHGQKMAVSGPDSSAPESD